MNRDTIALRFAVMLASKGVPMDRAYEYADEFLVLMSKKHDAMADLEIFSRTARLRAAQEEAMKKAANGGDEHV